jgi:hypothetical protein
VFLSAILKAGWRVADITVVERAQLEEHGFASGRWAAGLRDVRLTGGIKKPLFLVGKNTRLLAHGRHYRMGTI